MTSERGREAAKTCHQNRAASPACSNKASVSIAITRYVGLISGSACYHKLRLRLQCRRVLLLLGRGLDVTCDTDCLVGLAGSQASMAPHYAAAHLSFLKRIAQQTSYTLLRRLLSTNY